MKTLQLKADPSQLDSAQAQAAIEQAGQILRAGGTVALPTETVYGLGANALDPAAVARIFAAKQRPAWDPVIVHVASVEMLEGIVAELPSAAIKLIENFWPGPLTLLLPRSAAVPDSVTAGRPLVGVRMPAHPVALALIRAAGLPIAAPSANIFGHTSPTTAAHVLADLDGRIDAVLDAGPADHGLESTVLDPCQSPMIIYRPGAVTAEEIRAAAGEVVLYGAGGQLIDGSQEPPPAALPSPGVGLRHYAPRAKLILIDAPLKQLDVELIRAAKNFPGELVGVMLPEELNQPDAAAVYRWGRWSAPEELARNLYDGLRALDSRGCSVILCPLPPAEGIGAAIRDRLTKAAHKP